MKSTNILICGNTGMVGHAIYQRFRLNKNIRIYTSNSEYNNLMNYNQILEFLESKEIDIIIDCAARVGGILGNSRDNAGFLYDNMMMGFNLINAAQKAWVKKMIFLGSSCIYPKNAENPIKPDELLNGKLEETNEGYALAKISCIKLCQYYRRQYGFQYISLMPCNLFGDFDNYNLVNAHVIPNLIRKFDIAKEKNQPQVELYGDGTPLREFLYAGDLANACHKLCQEEDWSKFPDIINVGSGVEISIKDLANLIKKYMGYNGEIIWNTNYSNGTIRKLLDSSYIRSLGWQPSNYSFEDRIKMQIQRYYNEKELKLLRI